MVPMPQLNLLNPANDPIGLRIEWVDRTPELQGAFDVTIYFRRMEGDWTTLLVQRWTGTMLDFAATFTTDVTTAWLWGDRAEVLRAAVSCHRAARAHAKEHDKV